MNFLLGCLLGLVCGAFGAFGLYAIVRLMQGLPADSRLSRAVLVGATYAKLPVIAAGLYGALRLGRDGLAGFTLMIVVVYFVLVLRAARGGLY